MRRPSAALVVASAALVMATIGTSVAATHYTITRPGQIKPGSISLSALSKHARKALRGARGPAGAPGAAGATGAPGTPATKLWAQIGADGAVIASSGGVTARAGGATPGTYAVNFGQDVTHCAAMATQGSVAGAPLVRIFAAGIDLAPGFPSVSSVTVTTTSEVGGGSPTPTAFSIAAFC
jgi:hypothetical protein